MSLRNLVKDGVTVSDPAEEASGSHGKSGKVVMLCGDGRKGGSTPPPPPCWALKY